MALLYRRKMVPAFDFFAAQPTRKRPTRLFRACSDLVFEIGEGKGEKLAAKKVDCSFEKSHILFQTLFRLILE